ncbi:MAG: PKD domain-containing protein [Patescibacteria group bacterium]|jgi:hypothetical protein
MRKSKLPGLCALGVLILTVLFACERDWPVVDDTSTWSKNGYTLQVGSQDGTLKTAMGTIHGIKDLTMILTLIEDATGLPVPGTTFAFGDGGSMVGEQVNHTYKSTGTFTLTVTAPNGTTLSGSVEITEINSGTKDIYLIRGWLDNGKYYYQVALPIEVISDNAAFGTFYVASDLQGWNPGTALAQTVTANGKQYLVWEFTSPNGYQKFLHKKVFTAGGTNWAFNPTSAYWYTTTDGGLYRPYFKDGTMTVSASGASLPGKFGDMEDDWKVRGFLTYATNAGYLTLLVNKQWVINPNLPKINYQIDAGSWSAIALFDAGTYYSVSIPDAITYGSIVKFNIQPNIVGSTIDITGSALYSMAYGCGALQIQKGL